MVKREEFWNFHSSYELKGYYGDQRHLSIEKYSNDFRLLAHFSNEMKKEFKFHSTYEAQSQGYLQDIKLKHLAKLGVVERELNSLNFIGVHVRRTDYTCKYLVRHPSLSSLYLYVVFC